MHIELVANLRCTRPHENTWLVARADNMAGRHIVTGLLGCPVCQAEYPIVGGVALLGELEKRTVPAFAALPAHAALRLAALMDLTSEGGMVLLAGEWVATASELAEVADGVAIIAIESAAPPELDERISYLTAGEELPLQPGSARGIALGSGTAASAERLESAVRALRAGGRLIAPASFPLPSELRELGRDDRDWVAERVSKVTIVPLSRAREER
jgi:hypothetical protein